MQIINVNIAIQHAELAVDLDINNVPVVNQE